MVGVPPERVHLGDREGLAQEGRLHCARHPAPGEGPPHVKWVREHIVRYWNPTNTTNGWPIIAKVAVDHGLGSGDNIGPVSWNYPPLEEREAVGDGCTEENTWMDGALLISTDHIDDCRAAKLELSNSKNNQAFKSITIITSIDGYTSEAKGGAHASRVWTTRVATASSRRWCSATGRLAHARLPPVGALLRLLQHVAQPLADLQGAEDQPGGRAGQHRCGLRHGGGVLHAREYDEVLWLPLPDRGRYRQDAALLQDVPLPLEDEEEVTTRYAMERNDWVPPNFRAFGREAEEEEEEEETPRAAHRPKTAICRTSPRRRSARRRGARSTARWSARTACRRSRPRRRR